MTKVITFSQTFPAYHPRKGQPTDFAKKIADGTKVHTIRAGHRWKVGDVFSPRVWSGKPYNSPQVAIGPDMVVCSTWDIEYDCESNTWELKGTRKPGLYLALVAENDGLSLEDLLAWFPKSLSGQIICWSPLVIY